MSWASRLDVFKPVMHVETMTPILVGTWRVATGLRTPSKRGTLRRLRARGETLESIRIRER